MLWILIFAYFSILSSQRWSCEFRLNPLHNRNTINHSFVMFLGWLWILRIKTSFGWSIEQWTPQKVFAVGSVFMSKSFGATKNRVIITVPKSSIATKQSTAAHYQSLWSIAFHWKSNNSFRIVTQALSNSSSSSPSHRIARNVCLQFTVSSFVMNVCHVINLIIP